MAEGQVEAFAVEGKGEVVDGGVPGSGRGGGHGEGVATEEDTERLHPGVVMAATGGAEADESSVDLEAGVGYEGEMLVRPSAEVEHDAVTADEPRVPACRPHAIAVGSSSCSNAHKIKLIAAVRMQIYRERERETGTEICKVI